MGTLTDKELLESYKIQIGALLESAIRANARLAAADKLANKAAKFINEEVMGDGASNKTFRELDDSLLEYRKAGNA